MKLVKQKSQKYENNVEKQELSKLFDVLQSQLQESRMVQDQILTSIKDQKEQKENISQNQSMSLPQPSQTTILESPKDLIPSPIDEQVLETNRYLSLALQKLETLYKNQEEKLKKYKEFKKILIAAAYIECIKCNGLFKPNEFLPHANECTIIKKPIESPEISVKFDISEYSKYDNQFALTKKNNDSPELNKILDNYPQTKDFSHIKTINPQALLDNSSPLNTKSHQYNQNSFDYKINATSPINSFDQSKKKSFDYKVNSSSPINNLPQNDRNSITLGYLSSYINPISYTDRLHQETTKVLDREEQRKTKSFYGKPSYDDFDDNNDNLYNMPRPLVTKKSENKGYLHNLKEDSEINTFEGSHHKDLNLPFLKPELGSGYWDSPLNELFKKTTQNNIGEEKLKEFNTTLIPDGEIKTMSYVKKKSKGSSKGSNGNDNEEQGVKGLMKGGMKGYLDRRNSWNVNMTGEFLKKTFD